MSAADLMARIDASRGDHQRANDLIAEARDRYKPPEPPPPPPNEGINIGSIAHTALDFAGFIPGVGVVADLANAALYAAEGDYVNAGLSAAAAVPFIGDAAAAAKLASTAAVGLAGAAAAARNADNAADASRLADGGGSGGSGGGSGGGGGGGSGGGGGGGSGGGGGGGLHTRGYYPAPGERTITGYVDGRVGQAGGEITSRRPSGVEINRVGRSGTHYIDDPTVAHAHERYRDVAPDGTVREGIRKGAVPANEQHVRDLYRSLDEGRSRTRGGNTNINP